MKTTFIDKKWVLPYLVYNDHVTLLAYPFYGFLVVIEPEPIGFLGMLNLFPYYPRANKMLHFFPGDMSQYFRFIYNIYLS